MKTLALNKRARHDYRIVEEYEAGIVLSGQEVKSAKQGHVSLRGSHISIHHGEAYLVGAHISPYLPAGNLPHYDPQRRRKLLLHKKEILALQGKMKNEGITVIPLALFVRRGLIKVSIALAQGKKAYDKRADIAKREAKRRMQRALRQKQ